MTEMNKAEAEEEAQKAKDAIERVTGARDKMKYRNRIMILPDGRQFLTLARKPTATLKYLFTCYVPGTKSRIESGFQLLDKPHIFLIY